MQLRSSRRLLEMLRFEQEISYPVLLLLRKRQQRHVRAAEKNARDEAILTMTADNQNFRGI